MSRLLPLDGVTGAEAALERLAPHASPETRLLLTSPEGRIAVLAELKKLFDERQARLDEQERG